MAYRNKNVTMPSIDDIIMQIMGMSEALYNGDWTIGYSSYDESRPDGWPTAKYLLRFYGYEPNSNGWHTMVDMHIGVDVKTLSVVRQEQGEQRWRARWQLDSKPDYTARRNEQYQAAMYMDGVYGFGRKK